jgi:hypothetical protein
VLLSSFQLQVHVHGQIQFTVLAVHVEHRFTGVEFNVFQLSDQQDQFAELFKLALQELSVHQLFQIQVHVHGQVQSTADAIHCVQRSVIGFSLSVLR